MNGTTMIKNTSSHEYLGLTFSNFCAWDEHVKSWSRLNSRKSFEKNVPCIATSSLGIYIAMLFGIIIFRIKKATRPYSCKSSTNCHSSDKIVQH